MKGRKNKPNRVINPKVQIISKTKESIKRAKQYQELVKWYKKLKKQYSCKCGESDPRCIDFHHRKPESKTTTVSWLVGQRNSRKKILEEIEKCDPICSNCHRKLTLKEY